MRKTIFGFAVGAALLLGAFQNCGKLGFATGGTDKTFGGGLASLLATHPGGAGPADAPALAVNAHPRSPRKGTNVVITAIPQNLDSVSYSCASAARPAVVEASGRLDADQMMFNLVVNADVVCTFRGVNAALDKTISVPFEIDVECGSQSKSGAGVCEDFVCQSYAEIPSGKLNQVPARTADGVCYFTKIIGAVPHGPSDSSAGVDGDVLARDSGAAANASKAPAVLGRWSGSFGLLGPRTVKLAGTADTAAPLIVDDLLLVGLHAADVNADPAVDYRAFGVGVVTNFKDDLDTGTVSFKSTPLPLRKWADDGVSSKVPLEVTTFADVNRRQTLDVRAEDAGGTAELSDVFLRFE